jgi:hypothetical protein
MITKRVLGKNLKVGDTIKVGWNENLYYPSKPQNQDTIEKIEEFTGSSKNFVNKTWSKGARIARFKYLRCGMTIPNNSFYEVIK